MARPLITVQYMRAVTAMLVVLFHAGRNYSLWIPVGEGRVSLFFIVSGFILWWITANSKASPRIFLLRRLARLVPLYWLATFVLFVGSVLGFTHHPAVPAGHLIKSLLFIPHLDRSGRIFPVLIPGWTLVYEMFFCLVFAALLWIGERRRLLVATLVFGGLAGLGVLLHPTGPIAVTYTNEILLEFLAGIWLAHLWPSVRLPKAAAVAVLIVGIVLSFVALLAQKTLPFVVYSGIPALIIIVGALGLERAGLPPVGWLKRIGDAAYSIYLWHIPVIVIGSRALLVAHLRSPVIAIVLLTLASLAAGLIVHRFAEQPLTEFLFRCINRHRDRLGGGRPVAAGA